MSFPPSPVPSYTPPAAVQARVAALKEERADAGRAFQVALAAAKLQWEAEIVLAVEDGHNLTIEDLSRPLTTEEADLVALARQAGEIWGWDSLGLTDANLIRAYQANLLRLSTVFDATLCMPAALQCVQAGLVPAAVDEPSWGWTDPMIRERMVFRIEFLRRLYPVLHEHALVKQRANEAERQRLQSALDALNVPYSPLSIRLCEPATEAAATAATETVEVIARGCSTCDREFEHKADCARHERWCARRSRGATTASTGATAAAIEGAETAAPMLEIQDPADTRLSFGKHRSRTYAEAAKDGSYCDWVLSNKHAQGPLKAFRDWLESDA